jgi:hypothetical protein
MQCRSCGTPILDTFKHAMAQNECPACGGHILDEESLALIEDIENTIRSEAAVREETAHNLATVLVARYDINLRDPEQTLARTPTPISTPKAVPRKIAPPSTMRQAMQQATPGIVQTPQIPDGISDRERDQIFERAVREKYNIVDQVQADTLMDDLEETQALVPTTGDSVFSEGAANPILERERMARLARQQQAMNGGGQGVFRRGS